jgi:5'-3' exonuclease
MGIPSYFSYILKNYKGIIFKQKECETIDTLMMDCNSIIYDCYYKLISDYETISDDLLESMLIQHVIKQIEKYIFVIKPTSMVFIAFDGVAPFAKMVQQRKRRYKSLFMSQFEKPRPWNTSYITPGTQFMQNLSKLVNSHFVAKTDLKYIVSSSEIPGEGEHKMFAYLRENDYKKSVVGVYGLDSDLIMLSICNSKHVKNIYIIREEPDFQKKTSNRGEYNKDLIFIKEEGLSKGIKEESSAGAEDYMFMCILLGNDFLPGFPALNLRTNGYQHLMETYKKTIGNYENRTLYDGKIQWKWFSIFLNELSKNERQYMIEEYEIQNKKELHFKYKKYKTIEERISNIPIIHRNKEKYINPCEDGWEKRYYRSLSTSSSYEYIQGLEWVAEYYTQGTNDWKWHFKHFFPPLLQDLKQQHIHKYTNPHTSPLSQLLFVLPPSVLHKLGIQTSSSDPDTSLYDWTYSRYFWEAKPILNH